MNGRGWWPELESLAVQCMEGIQLVGEFVYRVHVRAPFQIALIEGDLKRLAL